MRQTKKKKGFTLVEMLVAATIAALLAAVGLVSYRTANRNARDARRKADLEQVRAAMELARIDNGAYPSGSTFEGVVGGLVSDGYLSNANIEDPRNVGTFVYSFVDSPSPSVCGNATKAYAVCAQLENAPDPDHPSYCVCNP